MDRCHSRKETRGNRERKSLIARDDQRFDVIDWPPNLRGDEKDKRYDGHEVPATAECSDREGVPKGMR